MKQDAVPNSKLPTKIRDTVRQNRRLLSHRFFIGYAYDLLRHTKLFLHWKELLSYFRKIRMVTWTIKIITFLFTVLQTGTLVLLSTVLFLVLLPILLLTLLCILLIATVQSRKSNRMMRTALQEKQIYVLFLPKDDCPFLKANARDLASNPNAAVLVISPYWIVGTGLFEHRFFSTVRKDGGSIYLIRRYYFFSLKKNVLKTQSIAYLF